MLPTLIKNFILWVLTWAFFFYHGSVFCLLTAKRCYVAWSEVYFICHTTALAVIALSFVLPKAKKVRPTSSSAKTDDANGPTDDSKKTN